MIALYTLVYIPNVIAQHEGHQIGNMSKSEKDSSMNSIKMDSSMKMANSFSMNLPMSRNGSGTLWMPDAITIYAYMKMTPKWNFMFHGNVFLRYTNQDISNKRSSALAQTRKAVVWQRRVTNIYKASGRIKTTATENMQNIY